MLTGPREYEIFKAFIHQGDDVNLRYKGLTLFHSAILNEKYHLIPFLIDSGASMNDKVERYSETNELKQHWEYNERWEGFVALDLVDDLLGDGGKNLIGRPDKMLEVKRLLQKVDN